MSRSSLSPGFFERNRTMPPIYPNNFLDHLTLTLEWMAVSLGLWGYPRVMSMDTHERSVRGVRAKEGP